MRCEEIMKQDVECVAPDDTAQNAARIMRDENIGFLPVCDDKERVLGTVTDRDLAIRVLAEGKDGSTKIGDVMTREVVACQPKDDIKKAEQQLSQHKKSRIMVIDDGGRLRGVISLSDLAQVDEEGITRLFREVTEREAPMP